MELLPVTPTMASDTPLYIGFDLSTQQLKGLVVNSDLKVVHVAKFDFDADSHGFPIKKGVLNNEAEHEVFAPVALWLQALDGVLETLRKQGLDFSRVKGISGAGQQHGSVYWGQNAESLLHNLDSSKALEAQLESAFSHPYSPNWQDSSTQNECDEFDAALGSPEELAQATGSKAHHVSSLRSLFESVTSMLTPSAEIHRSSNPAVHEETPRGLSEDIEDLIGVFLLGVAFPRPCGPVRHLRCVRDELVEHQERGVRRPPD